MNVKTIENVSDGGKVSESDSDVEKKKRNLKQARKLVKIKKKL